MAQKEKCRYTFEDGASCEEFLVEEQPFCFFHQPDLRKNNPESRERILKAVRANKRLDGAFLQDADLSHGELAGARLVHARLDGANLERAHLEGAHLYGASLRGANLFNANLRRANLKETNLEGANLLEAKIDDAKLLGIHWGKGKRIQNEIEARKLAKEGDAKSAKVKFREAEEIYRNIRTHMMAAGIFEEAADFFYREMTVRRKQMPFFSIKRISSKVIDLVCGYGEKTFRVILSAASLVLLNSVVYFFAGTRYGSEVIAFDPAQSLQTNIYEYFLSLYFSVVTCTTLGYGDIAPLDWSRPFTMAEAFLGAFMIALFVLVFGRKMIR